MDRSPIVRTAGSLAVAAYPAREVRIRPARRRELLAHFSGAFDLSEGRGPSHAARVAFLGHQVALAAGLGAEGASRALEVGLLHAAGASLNLGLSEGDGAAWVAEQFALPEAVVDALRSVGERWDGRGDPLGRGGTDVPVEALCVAAAHWASEYADQVGHPLRARALLQRTDGDEVLRVAGPQISAALQQVLRDDETWLTFFGDDLPGAAARLGVTQGKPSRSQVQDAVAAMGAVIDASVREPGRAARVGSLSRALAADLGMSDGVCEVIELAGQLIDIGQLSLARSIVDKPSILTVDEMEQMRRHPGVGARLLEAIPGFEELTGWVEQHHERPDGRGYPEMLDGDDLALPGRILAVADAYWALRAHRPYRPAHSAAEAVAILRDGAGRQFDASVVEVLDLALQHAASLEDAGAHGFGAVDGGVAEELVDERGLRLV
jgi:response regulator RpfG family c-di-GMP phosphodiesterase